MPSLISDDIAAFLSQGLSLLVGTCDRDGAPECMRAMGLWLHPDRQRLTVYLPEATSQATLQNVRENPRLALIGSWPLTHRSYQIKGTVTQVAPAEESARPILDRYLAEFGDVLEKIGMPTEVVTLLSHWPSVAVELRIEELYEATPGPGAGSKLGGGPVR